MDINPFANESGGPSSTTAEFYFLIARFLSESPCRNAFEALQKELEIHGLLPKMIDALGNEHHPTYAQVYQNFAHIRSNHLLEICRRLGPLMDKEMPTNIYGQVQLLCQTLGHRSPIYCVLFDRTGQYIFTGADDFLVKIWRVANGCLMATLRGHSAEISDLAVSHDNSLLAAGSVDKIIRVWCLRTAAPIAVLIGRGGTIDNLEFCPAVVDEPRYYLASTCSAGFVYFWQYVVEPGQAAKFSPTPCKFTEKIGPDQAGVKETFVSYISFSPGGMLMATGSSERLSPESCIQHVRVYFMFGDEGPDRIFEQKAHTGRINSVQWANTGLRFITGSEDGTALIWRYEQKTWQTVQLRTSYRAEGGTPEVPSRKLKVAAVQWSLDDRYVIATAGDFSIKIWLSSNGLLHKELKGHEEEVFVLEPNPYDSNVLLSAGHDGRLFIWDMSKGEVIKSFVNVSDDEDERGAFFDAKWNPAGSMIAATDSEGYLSIYGIGSNESYKTLPKAMFFHTDYRLLLRDSAHHVRDQQTRLKPHLMPPPFLVNSIGEPYPPYIQKLVPGRENLEHHEQIPLIVTLPVGKNQEMLQVEMPLPPGADNTSPPDFTPFSFGPRRTRPNIDDVIELINQQQESQENLPRSPQTDAYDSSEPIFTSRTRTPAGVKANPNDYSVHALIEDIPSESVDSVSHRVIIEPLTIDQLASIKNEKGSFSLKEMTLLCKQIKIESPNPNTSVSPVVTALPAGRSQDVSGDGSLPQSSSLPAGITCKLEPGVVPATVRSQTSPVVPVSRPSATVVPTQEPIRSLPGPSNASSTSMFCSPSEPSRGKQKRKRKDVHAHVCKKEKE